MKSTKMIITEKFKPISELERAEILKKNIIKIFMREYGKKYEK